MSSKEPHSNTSSRLSRLEEKLRQLDTQRKAIVEEIAAIQSAEAVLPAPVIGTAVSGGVPQTPEEKVELFLMLFRCRESVYPKLWENKSKGTKGYAPACRNEWLPQICEKPRIKCSVCPNQAFPFLDAEAVRGHLQGHHTIGTYAIREDDTCTFLAADFDGEGWKKDVTSYRRSARPLGVDVHIERSRSGNGAHAWIFFLEPVRAVLARRLGTMILARAMREQQSMNLATYDRFFPNQDYLPRGGFGNLIALPLQKQPRENGNSVFLDEELVPFPNQWEYLAGSRRISQEELREILEREMPGFDPSAAGDSETEVLDVDERLVQSAHPLIYDGLFRGTVAIDNGAQLSINTDDLPGALINALKRLATFANPKFYELQRLRFPTYPHPRFIFAGETQPGRLLLPRGVIDSCLQLLRSAGAQVVVRDSRNAGKKMKIHFNGTLLPAQADAVQALSRSDIGILVAPPGAGKTVIACALLAKRKVATLVLVHRQPLMDQWKERLSTFLGVPQEDVGAYGSSKKKLSGRIDIAMIQTLTRSPDAEDIFSRYGQLIIDECHHVPAITFESLLKQSPARYVLGLTATPYRKDGHQKIMFMQCGPVRHEMRKVEGQTISRQVIVRETEFRIAKGLGERPPLHVFWEELIADQGRLELVVGDIVSSVRQGVLACFVLLPFEAIK